MNYQNTRWLLLSFVVLLLDQYTKYLAVLHLHYAIPYPLIAYQRVLFFDPVSHIGLNLTLLYNKGIAFSLFSSTALWVSWLLCLFSLSVCVGLFVYLLKAEAKEKVLLCGLSLIVGGALGNGLDRIRLGYVVDFIDFFVKGGREFHPYHWPAFNVADSAVVLGALLLMRYFFKKTYGQ